MKRTAAALLLVIGVLTTITAAGAESGSAMVPGDNLAERGFHTRYVSAYQSATTLEELQFAPDFTAEHANLLRLYQAFFNREPDLGGAKYWMGQWDLVRAAGPTAQRPDGHDLLGEFADYFTLVPEFVNTYGAPANDEFLTRVYANMLGREPDAGGYDYWLGFLEGTNPEQPGVVLSKGATMRWVTQNEEFIVLYPFGHPDRSAHPSDDADCTLDNVEAFSGQNITGIYRLRDGDIRELCYGLRDINVEEAWTRLVEISDLTHHSPVALLAVYEGNGAGIVAYAGPSTSNGSYTEDIWLMGAQDTATRIDPQEADLTMSHEMSHVFTQLDDQIDYSSSNVPGLELPSCGDRLEAFVAFCFRQDSILNQWVQTFWSESEIAVWETNLDLDSTNDIDTTSLCVTGHDFAGNYATSSPYEDLAEAFSAYVHGVDKPNLTAKYAFFEARPILKAYKDRAITAGRYGYSDSFGSCFA